MKIVVLDGYTENPGDLSWDGLSALGELTVYDRTSLTDEAEAIARIGDAEIVYTNKTPITKRVFDVCPNIKFVAALATGYNVIDVAYAKEKGIPVCNVPVYGTRSVSQFAIALLLEVCHHIGHHSQTVYEGKWVILLALTSNKGAFDFQFLPVDGEKKLFEQVLETSQQWGNPDNMMYVVGATKADMLTQVRAIVPNSFLLVPGVGAQGGSLEEVCKYGLTNECGLLVNSSRGIIYASNGLDFAERAGEEARKLQQQMAAVLK